MTGLLNPHQIVVHFPVALLLAGAAFGVWSAIGRSETWARLAWGNQVLGTLGAILAVISGRAAEHDAEKLGVVESLIEWHERLGYIAAAYWAGYLFLVWFWLTPVPTGRKRGLAIGLQLLGAVLVGLAAHQGGRIVEAMIYR